MRLADHERTSKFFVFGLIFLEDCYRRKSNQMLGINCFRKIVTSFTAAAVLCVYSSFALAAPTDLTGEITVTGQVSVNGQAAVSNSTVMSGSTIVTGPGSSAIISLGKRAALKCLLTRTSFLISRTTA